MNRTWIWWLALVLALTCLVPAAVAQTEAGGANRARSQMARFNADRTQMSDEQRAAYDKALQGYAAAEDQALQALVQSGDIEQRRVDQFQSMRDMQGAMASIDRDGWTDAERQQFQDATAVQGDERTAALGALVSSGLLTQSQADALASGGGFGGRMRGNADGQAQDGAPATQFDPDNMPEGFDPDSMPEGFDPDNMPEGFDPDNMPEGFDPDNMPEGMDAANLPEGAGQRQSTDIWSDIANMEQTEAIQGALSSLQAAQQVFLAALEDAGISLPSN